METSNVDGNNECFFILILGMRLFQEWKPKLPLCVPRNLCQECCMIICINNCDHSFRAACAVNQHVAVGRLLLRFRTVKLSPQDVTNQNLTRSESRIFHPCLQYTWRARLDTNAWNCGHKSSTSRHPTEISTRFSQEGSQNRIWVIYRVCKVGYDRPVPTVQSNGNKIILNI